MQCAETMSRTEGQRGPSVVFGVDSRSDDDRRGALGVCGQYVCEVRDLRRRNGLQGVRVQQDDVGFDEGEERRGSAIGGYSLERDRRPVPTRLGHLGDP